MLFRYSLLLQEIGFNTGIIRFNNLEYIWTVFGIMLIINYHKLTLNNNMSITKILAKSFESPDEVRTFEKGRVEIVNLGNVIIGRATLEPGWSWGECVKPLVKTDSCLAPHTSVIISGRMKVRMDDGTEIEGGPGDTAVIPPGHDAWVVGDEACVSIDFTGIKKKTKKQE